MKEESMFNSMKTLRIFNALKNITDEMLMKKLKQIKLSKELLEEMKKIKTPVLYRIIACVGESICLRGREVFSSILLDTSLVKKVEKTCREKNIPFYKLVEKIIKEFVRKNLHVVFEEVKREGQEGEKKLNFLIDDKVWRKFKAQCIRERKMVKEVVERQILKNFVEKFKVLLDEDVEYIVSQLCRCGKALMLIEDSLVMASWGDVFEHFRKTGREKVAETMEELKRCLSSLDVKIERW
ncbi:MAG: hypothetical protein B6U95_00140 [Thermofilum sp. ex4484_82]|nr:MAG: hypothetical protein B6U95_00140 [Thermofilum sp. ex4484_82]OYT40139.1 MAG: hypothetical protein B6U96_00140 [Archaeoglobales archaeon ex4484_92]